MTRYELLDRIGVGGMAEIFRGKAVAAGGFEKPVAIKRILPHLSQDKRFVELLIAEAKVLSLLKHRNIVQIFDVGLGDDGQYFLVMEYVDGKDVGAVQKSNEVKRRRMPFDLALHIGAEICEALEHAHSAKAPDGKPMSLVHRDVSPSNVLLSRAGEVKLTDFGIAKRAEQEQTGTGGVRGKFAYISPEQARNEHIEPRSDVFSVAILIWELATNRRLFSGLGDLEALRAVREAQAQRPTEIDPRLSPEIDKILMAALSRDPKRRPTAGQFGEQLRSLRYSLDVTVGDPATELGKILDAVDQVQRESQQLMVPPVRGVSGFESSESTAGEHTVIRIRTADVFSMKDKDGRGMAAARQVIDHFEEEQTRQAQLTGDQLRMLRGARRDSSELSAPPPPRPDNRSRRPTDEPTTARPPLHSEEIETIAGRGIMPPGDNPFDGDEATRLVAPTSRRTPPPERVKAKSQTAPPPLPGMTQAKAPVRPRGPTPGPPPGAELPSTVHQRNPRLQSIGGPPAMPGGPPPMPADMMMNEAPPTLDDAPLPGTMHQRNPRSGVPGAPPSADPRSGRSGAMPPANEPRTGRSGAMPPSNDPFTGRAPPTADPRTGRSGSMPPANEPRTGRSGGGIPPAVLQTPTTDPRRAPGVAQLHPPAPLIPTPVPQQPPMQPMMPTPVPQQQPPMQQPQGNYPNWGAPPQAPLLPPMQQQRPPQQAPMLATPAKKPALQPWMLVVGALVMAALAFAVTRAFISG